MTYEEFYFNTVRSLHRNIPWEYRTPFKQVFIPWPEKESRGHAFVNIRFNEHLLFEYAYDSCYMQQILARQDAESKGSTLLTLMIHTAIHETAHHRQTLMMLDEGWDYASMISYTQHHGVEWKKCMKELGIKNPKAKELGFGWTQEFKYPELLQQIIDDVSEDVWTLLAE